MFVLYLIFVTLLKVENNTFNKKTNKLRRIIIAIDLICIFTDFVLPIKLYSNNGIIYSYGLATQFVYGVSGICAVICTVLMLINFKRIEKILFLNLKNSDLMSLLLKKSHFQEIYY